MVSSNRRPLACILLILATASFAHAQKDQTATISGKVTLKNKGVPGIVVVATEADSNGGWQRSRNRGTTDEDGNYRINNVPTGNYQVYPVAPVLVVESGQSNQRLSVTGGETIRDINFAMVHGGVITGRITDADGQPMIEEVVSVSAVEPELDYQRPDHGGGIVTDDRGVYRAFGLRPGKYKVSVGESAVILAGYVRKVSRQTFYPSVTDAAKATILEVNESSELKDVDIVTSPPATSFKVAGRIIDGETGKPLTNIMLSVSQTEGDSTVSSGGIITNSDGEFILQNAAPGKYRLFAIPRENATWRADPLTVDVVDKDVTGLEIKTRRGASLQGVVILESPDDKTVAAKLSDLMIFASVTSPSSPYIPTLPVPINPDGSFKIGGLDTGTVRLSVRARDRFQLIPLEVVSIEQNGVAQPDVINLKDGEQVTGLRIVVKPVKRTGGIRGQIKFENGELPLGNRIIVVVNRLDENSSPSEFEGISSPPEVDSRGRFLIERLQAGTYELRVMIFRPDGQLAVDVPKQQVTVSDNVVSEVTVTVKLKP